MINSSGKRLVLLVYLKTIFKIGISNIFLVLRYRLALKSLYFKIRYPIKAPSKNNFIFKSHVNEKKTSIQKAKDKFVISNADKLIEGNYRYFSNQFQILGSPPKWFFDPFNRKSFINTNAHWSTININKNYNYDIKIIWEPSRFDWTLVLANAYLISKNKKYLETLNNWIINWRKNNWTYAGPNWMCGQETSIRLINFLLSVKILDKYIFNEDPVIQFTFEHCKRISHSTYYAKAQDNNHGTSEAVALYLGASFLIKNFEDNYIKKEIAIKWYKSSRSLLINRVNKLILADGTFSQYSLNYHRLLIDSLSVVEFWRGLHQFEKFDELFYIKSKLAIQWYSEIIDPISGSGPNYGGNDGACLLSIGSEKYRDFRPSLSLASSIFKVPIRKTLFYKHWLKDHFDIPDPALVENFSQSRLFSQGGQIKLIKKNGKALLRVPLYKFRPCQSDALHVDVWEKGENWIRDTGTFSYDEYNSDINEFSGTRGHSTIQFDDKNQMPRLSKFLFGAWLTPINLSFDADQNSGSSGYKDYNDNTHIRTIKSINNGWEICDSIKGGFKKAVMRYFLKPERWIIKGSGVSSRRCSIIIKSQSFCDLALINANESLHYMEKTKVPLFQITINEPSIIKTFITFKN